MSSKRTLPRKLLLKNNQCPGDILMLTAAVRDLKRAYPDIQIAVATRHPFLWENNPYINHPEREYELYPLGYQTPHQTKNHPAREHFIYAFHSSLERDFDIKIPRGAAFPDIHLTYSEKNPYLMVEKPILLINAGSKGDFPIKQWPIEYYQEIAYRCADKYTVVQIGETRTGKHPKLKGVIDMVDKTPGRDIVRLMWQASAVLTGVSFPMHLCAALNHLDGARKCVVIAGNREDTAWEKYPDMYYLQKPCNCVEMGTGCWKRLLPPLPQYDNEVCSEPVRKADLRYYAKCIADITPEDVVKCLL